MTTKPPSRTADQFVLRLPDGMRDRIAELAKENSRSMNAEIVQRLEWALELTRKPQLVDSADVQQQVGGALTQLVTNEIKQLADRERISFDEMFTKIVLAGLRPDATQVVYLPVFPGATKDEQRAAAEVALEIKRPDATVMIDNLWRARWAPDWMIEVMKAKCPEVIAQVADQKIMSFDAEFTSEGPVPEPPKPRKRIVRPASKKTTEK